MSNAACIRTTIPPRTYGSRAKATTPGAILLRMSFLEMERQRRVKEVELLNARAIKLYSRIEAIDREKLELRKALDHATEPLASGGMLPVTRAALCSSNQSRARNGFAIRY
jgi:hypothetical protein